MPVLLSFERWDPRVLPCARWRAGAGVSHNAPYRHFRDKDELISAIVGQGFERLNDAMIG
jgi:hypothetical protein